MTGADTSSAELLATLALLDKELARVIGQIRFHEMTDDCDEHRRRVNQHELEALRIQRRRYSERRDEILAVLETQTRSGRRTTRLAPAGRPHN
ncbi:MAG TPA: hypothetical protein VGM03_22540 [Phycisphaerae bacterium]|jgi:septal ring factor EnvC (AmiA/AmiB activator)